MVDFGTRRQRHSGRSATSSAIAPPTTTRATAAKPHQPRRFRQNCPASTVNSANVA